MSKNMTKNKEIIEIISSRIIDGERFTIDGVIEEFYQPRSILAAMKAKTKAYLVISNACRAVEKEGYVAGAVSKGIWGIPKDEAEFMHMLGGKFAQMVGRNKQAHTCVRYAQRAGISLEGITTETISIPAIRKPLPVEAGKVL